MTQPRGILLTNTGTPDNLTVSAVRRYLAEFLSDPHIVQLPRWLWLPILYGVILPTRPRRSVKLYEKIWTNEGSPMRTIMYNLKNSLQKYLYEQNVNTMIAIGMHYGEPSIPQAVAEFKKNNIEEIFLLPLFPQYSTTTVKSSIHKVNTALCQQDYHPRLTISPTYATHADYIAALTNSVRQIWDERGKTHHLLISFHGIPEKFIKKGDPYQQQCEQTANLLAKSLQLADGSRTLCYQSRFGYSEWLKPSTQQLLLDFPQKNIKAIDIICPGFAVDCLETLEEIALRGKETFLAAGGEQFTYIPALNTEADHICLLAKLILSL